MKEKEKKEKDRHEKIVQSELFVLRNINQSDWVDSSKSSDYVPESTPSSDNYLLDDSPKKKPTRASKKKK